MVGSALQMETQLEVKGKNDKDLYELEQILAGLPAITQNSGRRPACAVAGPWAQPNLARVPLPRPESGQTGGGSLRLGL